MGEHDVTDSVVDIQDVSKIRIHPKYEHSSANFDFSILYMTNALTSLPVCLPASTQSLYDGSMATVIGWGLTSSDGDTSSTLQEAEVEVISNQECSDHYPGKIERYQYSI